MMWDVSLDTLQIGNWFQADCGEIFVVLFFLMLN